MDRRKVRLAVGQIAQHPSASSSNPCRSSASARPICASTYWSSVSGTMP
jgi:hypothetical protein